jgi:hypothetical protein
MEDKPKNDLLRTSIRWYLLDVLLRRGAHMLPTGLVRDDVLIEARADMKAEQGKFTTLGNCDRRLHDLSDELKPQGWAADCVDIRSGKRNPGRIWLHRVPVAL